MFRQSPSFVHKLHKMPRSWRPKFRAEPAGEDQIGPLAAVAPPSVFRSAP